VIELYRALAAGWQLGGDWSEDANRDAVLAESDAEAAADVN
jgi:hypothetical protein